MEEAMPERPCPYCGTQYWAVERAPKSPPCMWPATCTGCHVLVDKHWVDGRWMGSWVEAGRPESLSEFVHDKARQLRAKENR